MGINVIMFLFSFSDRILRIASEPLDLKKIATYSEHGINICFRGYKLCK